MVCLLHLLFHSICSAYAVGGGPDILPDELAQSAAGFVVCLGVAALAIVFSTLAIVCSTLALFGMVDLDCDAPAAEELGPLFSFQTAVDALEVADAVRPASSANAGLTLVTARPPGLCNFSLLALPCIHR